MGEVIAVRFGKGGGKILSGSQPELAGRLARRARAIGGDPNRAGEAERLYRDAIQLDPECPGAHAGLGRLLLTKEHYEEAEELLEHASTLDPRDAEAFLGLGILRLATNDPHAAVLLFTRALHADGDLALAHGYLALSCELLGRHDHALRHWKRYAALDPTGPLAGAAVRSLRRQLAWEMKPSQAANANGRRL